MARIGVLGLGNWGTALAKVWLMDGRTVSGWTIEDEVYESISERQVNEKYLAGVDLSGMRVSMQADEVLEDSDILILAVPSGVILGVVDDLAPRFDPRHILVDVAKGLAPGDQLVSEAIEVRLKAVGGQNSLAVLTGPTIAAEVARGVLSTALVASREPGVAEQLVETLSAPTLRLHAAHDPHGAELWGAFKNVIALACGVVDGLKELGLGGDNLKAAAFNAGYREGCGLLPHLGAQPETALSPAGIGDLFVTATSPHGRNRTMGEKLGRGKSLEEAREEMHMVSEGVRATHMFAERARAEGLAAPFVELLNGLLEGDLGPEECVRQIVALD